MGEKSCQILTLNKDNLDFTKSSQITPCPFQNRLNKERQLIKGKFKKNLFNQEKLIHCNSIHNKTIKILIPH